MKIFNKHSKILQIIKLFLMLIISKKSDLASDTFIHIHIRIDKNLRVI
jgi:hypothetical protein